MGEREQEQRILLFYKSGVLFSSLGWKASLTCYISKGSKLRVAMRLKYRNGKETQTKHKSAFSFYRVQSFAKGLKETFFFFNHLNAILMDAQAMLGFGSWEAWQKELQFSHYFFSLYSKLYVL